MSTLEGVILGEPRLRFDAAVPSNSDPRPFQGLARYGPYDSSQVVVGPKKLLFVFPKELTDKARGLANDLVRGRGNYPGFEKLFRIAINPREVMTSLQIDISMSASDNQVVEAYRAGIETWANTPGREDPDIAFVVVPLSDRWETERPYYEAKALFAKMGIPTQMVTRELLDDHSRFGWSVANIALAAFAKLGGVPWTVEAPPGPSDLVIGIGRSDISVEGRRVRTFGYAMCFVSNGLYLTTQTAFAPVSDDATYLARLTEAVEAALTEQARLTGSVGRVVFHLSKRTGSAEVQAARDALKNAGIVTPVAFLRVDDSTLWDLMDGSHATYAPPKGLFVRVGERRALLQTEGLSKVGPPHGPLLIELDDRSDVPPESLDGLALQVFRLAHVNWRGFNARARPVTLFYGEKLAELVGYLGHVDVWDPMALREDLRRRPWFL